MTYQDEKSEFDRHSGRIQFRIVHLVYVVTAMADSRIVLVGSEADRDVWSSILNIADGREWTDSDLDAACTFRRPKIGNWVRLGLFVLVAIFPLPWVWLNSRSMTGKKMGVATA